MNCSTTADIPLNGVNAFFQGLGDLPGGDFKSAAYAISADGSVVAGQSSSASGSEAFRWTLAGGIVGLGDLAGGYPQQQTFA